MRKVGKHRICRELIALDCGVASLTEFREIDLAPIHLADFREESNLYTWLYRIGTNEALTWIEQKKRHTSVSVSGNEDFFSERLVAQKDFDPNKIEWKLQQAIQTLPEKQRIGFNLRYYDEMPYEEMAGVLDTSVGALKASFHHAVKKVEAFLVEN